MEHSDNISGELYSRIERYLMDQMTGDEKLAFEDEIIFDSNLAKKVYEVRLLLLGIMEKKLQDKLPVLHEGFKKKKISFTQKWWIAVVVVIIISVLVWILLNIQR